MPGWAQFTVDTVAGGKIQSGVPAQSAVGISGTAHDPAGNIYFCAGTVIRRIRADGIVGTVAGTGISGYFGDGRPAIAANLIVSYSCAADTKGHLFFFVASPRIRRI